MTLRESHCINCQGFQGTSDQCSCGCHRHVPKSSSFDAHALAEKIWHFCHTANRACIHDDIHIKELESLLTSALEEAEAIGFKKGRDFENANPPPWFVRTEDAETQEKKAKASAYEECAKMADNYMYTTIFDEKACQKIAEEIRRAAKELK